MIKKIFLFATLMILSSSYGHAESKFSLVVHNVTPKMEVFNVYWMNPTWEGCVGPFLMAGGEIPAKERRVIADYPEGKYCIVWNKYDYVPICVDTTGKKEVTFYPPVETIDDPEEI